MAPYCEIFPKLRFKLYLIVLLLVRAAETECLRLVGVKVQLHAEVAEDDSPLQASQHLCIQIGPGDERGGEKHRQTRLCRLFINLKKIFEN